jgi:hypothetical protein
MFRVVTSHRKENMKKSMSKISGKAALLGAFLATANVVMAQTAMTTTTTTSSAGTVGAFTPDAFTVTTSSSPTPVRYTYTKTTKYVDEDGNPVSVETVKSGLPVTVYYNTDGDHMVADRVVVRKSVDISPDGAVTKQVTTTSTTSTQGTVSSFNPEAIAVKTDSSPTPVRTRSAKLLGTWTKMEIPWRSTPLSQAHRSPSITTGTATRW